jgi:site-specific DNA-methyltransferase (adenine-specific)
MMSKLVKSEKYTIFNQSCEGFFSISENTIDALVTDPPYGISFQNHQWDKALPKRKIWEEGIKVLKYGAFGLVFSSVRLMHRLMVDLEDSGFLIKDVIFWAYLNGMPKSREVALDIDKELGVESKVVGKYNYVQGYKKGGAMDYYTKGVKLKYAPSSELIRNPFGLAYQRQRLCSASEALRDFVQLRFCKSKTPSQSRCR